MKWIDYKKEKPQLYLKVWVAVSLENGFYHCVVGSRQYSGFMDERANPLSGSNIFWQHLPQPPKK